RSQRTGRGFSGALHRVRVGDIQFHSVRRVGFRQTSFIHIPEAQPRALDSEPRRDARANTGYTAGDDSRASLETSRHNGSPSLYSVALWAEPGRLVQMGGRESFTCLAIMPPL